MGAEPGESRFTTTAVAPSSAGTNANPHHEPTASCGPEPRATAQAGAVEPSWTSAIGIVLTGSLGQPASARLARTARPPEPHDRGVDGGGGKGSGENARGPTANDTSRGGPIDRARLRAHRRDSAAFSLRQANGELLGADPG